MQIVLDSSDTCLQLRSHNFAGFVPVFTFLFHIHRWMKIYFRDFYTVYSDICARQMGRLYWLFVCAVSLRGRTVRLMVKELGIRTTYASSRNFAYNSARASSNVNFPTIITVVWRRHKLQYLYTYFYISTCRTPTTLNYSAQPQPSLRCSTPDNWGICKIIGQPYDALMRLPTCWVACAWCGCAVVVASLETNKGNRTRVRN